MKIIFINGALMLASTLIVGSAAATPRPLPFSYPNETLSKGTLEIEQYTDVNPLRAAADPANTAAGNVWSPAYALTTEIEYGVSDRVELGFYQVFAASPVGGDNALLFDGLKWRVRTRLAEPGEWPVDVGLYLELETMHDELALEGKINLQRRIGRVRTMANLWVEEAISRPLDTVAQGRQANFIINPTAGAVFEVSPSFQPGIEYWARGMIAPTGGSDQERTNNAVHHFLGGTVHVNFGKLWWTAGLYANFSGPKDPVPGDAYGPVWFRSVIGIEL